MEGVVQVRTNVHSGCSIVFVVVYILFLSSEEVLAKLLLVLLHKLEYFLFVTIL